MFRLRKDAESEKKTAQLNQLEDAARKAYEKAQYR
jgi:hypothetical protein